jgi:hypothetical protein
VTIVAKRLTDEQIRNAVLHLGQALIILAKRTANEIGIDSAKTVVRESEAALEALGYDGEVEPRDARSDTKQTEP